MNTEPTTTESVIIESESTEPVTGVASPASESIPVTTEPSTDLATRTDIYIGHDGETVRKAIRVEDVFPKEVVDAAMDESRAKSKAKGYDFCFHIGFDPWDKQHKRLKICELGAGWGTRHKGTGFCKWHGGGGGQVKHGMYSTFLEGAPTLERMFREFEARGEDVKQLHEEITLVRTMLGKLMRELKDFDGNATEDEQRRHWLSFNRTMAGLLELIEQVRKLVETQSKVDAENRDTFTFESVTTLCWLVRASLIKHVKEPEVLRAVFSDLAAAQLLGAKPVE